VCSSDKSLDRLTLDGVGEIFSRKNAHMSVKRRSRPPGFGVRPRRVVDAHPRLSLAIVVAAVVGGGCGNNHGGATGGAGGATAASAGATNADGNNATSAASRSINLLVVAKGS
jgi:hypothetical protein